MPEAESARLPLGGTSDRLYQYAVLRLVPDVAKGERLNCGVVLLAKTARFLGLRTVVEVDLWRALCPTLDVDAVTAHLGGLVALVAGDPRAGPVAALSETQRFHWLTSPASTLVQPGPVHTGLGPAAADWDGVLDGLAEALMR